MYTDPDQKDQSYRPKRLDVEHRFGVSNTDVPAAYEVDGEAVSMHSSVVSPEVNLGLEACSELEGIADEVEQMRTEFERAA